MAEKTQSLSDDRSSDRKFVTVTDTVDLPKTRKEIVNAFQRILDLGHVQKVVVELNRPIQFSRLIPEDLLAEGQTPMEDDPLDAVRAAELDELTILPGVKFVIPSTIGVLFKAFEQLVENHYQPRMFVVGSYVELRKWLKLPELYDVTHLFGVPVKKSKNMPDDGLILSGVNPADPERIAYSIKINLDEVK
jgi:hypothetical protein